MTDFLADDTLPARSRRHTVLAHNSAMPRVLEVHPNADETDFVWRDLPIVFWVVYDPPTEKGNMTRAAVPHMQDGAIAEDDGLTRFTLFVAPAADETAIRAAIEEVALNDIPFDTFVPKSELADLFFEAKRMAELLGFQTSEFYKFPELRPYLFEPFLNPICRQPVYRHRAIEAFKTFLARPKEHFQR